MINNNAFISHYQENLEVINKLKNEESLRDKLSRMCSIPSTIFFYENTTATVDKLLHSFQSGQELIYTNLEHPCIEEVFNSYTDKFNIHRLDMYPLLLKGKLDQLSNSLIKKDSKPRIYFLSHMHWASGVRIDIEQVALKVKLLNPKNIVIIDGAQAVGNIESLFAQGQMPECIDYYIGCTHKWLETKNTLGFVSVSNKSLGHRTDKILKNLALSDSFGEFAGQVQDKINWGSSTKDMMKLSQIIRDLKIQRENSSNLKRVIEMPVTLKMNKVAGETGKFIGYYSKFKELETMDNYNEFKELTVEDKNSDLFNCWVRHQRN